MIAVISVTKAGEGLGKKILKEIEGVHYSKRLDSSFSLDNITKNAFDKYDGIVFISSTGIAVRAISKYIISKDKDPAVVVVDNCNNFTISLLSGHLGGANELTKKISNILGNIPVITTATDNLNLLAPDLLAKENNLYIDDLKKAKYIAARLVAGEDVYFFDEHREILCPKGYINSDVVRENSVIITDTVVENNNILSLIRKDIVLGIGCRRDTSPEKLKELVLETLKENKIHIKSIFKIGSIDIKKDEKAILDLGEYLEVEMEFFSKEQISTFHNKYIGSDFVEKTLGVRAVSEPVIDLLNGEIIVNKIAKAGITLTIGRVIRKENNNG